MAEARGAPGGGAQRVLLIMLGVLLPALLLFFGWLATSIVEIKISVAKTERDVASLLETRQTDVRKRVDHNTLRLEAIDTEKDNEPDQPNH